MTTSRFLATVLGVLLVISLGIWVLGAPSEGEKKLIWVSDNNPARVAQIEGFNEVADGKDVRLDYANAGIQKVVLQAVSGVGPDLFDFSDEFLGSYVEAGVLWDVTEAAAEMGFSADSDLWPAARNTVVFQGRQYGYPCNTSADILVYNKNVFDHFGVPYPTGLMTWPEFFELAEKVNRPTSDDPTRYPPIYAITGLGYATFFASLRGEFFHEDGSLNIRDNADLRTAIEMFRDSLFRHRITPTSFEAKVMSGQGGWGSGNLNQFGAGRYAMAVTGHWSLIAFGRAHQLQIEALEREGIDVASISDPLKRPIRVGACLLPRFPDREPCYRVGSRVAGISRFSPDREEALQFLQYLAGPKYAKILNEGTDALPGNPRYAALGVTEGPADLSRVQLQETTEKAMTMGYVPSSSPYLLIGEATRSLREQMSRLESDPSLPIQTLLDAAERDLATVLRRNLERNPDLKVKFEQQFGEGAVERLR